MPPIALSTMWMRDRFSSLEEFFEAAQEVGFERFELNHFVSQEMVQTARLPAGRIHAIHAPCPTRAQNQHARLSSTDGDERDSAVEAVRASIDLAYQVGAGAVVLHAGEIDVNPGLEQDLRLMYDLGQRESLAYRDLKIELVAERRRLSGPHLDATRKSLERLATFADDAGVRIGLENRYHYHEIPLPDEMDLLLEDFAGPVGFWLDTGHAYVLEELGFVAHDEWFTGFGEQLVGAHLHDVRVVDQPIEPGAAIETGRGLRDHLAAGLGVVDFGQLLPLASDSVLLTCEFECFLSPEVIKDGLAFLTDIGLAG